MAEQIFLSVQEKRSVIISNKRSIYELSRELPNDLRFRILENYCLVLSTPSEIKILSILPKFP